MEIAPDLAREAVGKIAEYFGLSVDEAALGIVKIVNTNMSGLLQSMTVKRGYDPREFALVAFGGAGPIHASAIAREINVPTVIVPPSSGVFSAWGMLMADLRHDFSQTYIAPMDQASVDSVNAVFAKLEGRVRDLFELERIPEGQIALSYSVDLRYIGQEHTLRVPAPARMKQSDKPSLDRSFDDMHLRIYGHNAPEERKEIVSLQVMGIGKVRKPVLEKIARGAKSPTSGATLGKRRVYVGSGTYEPFSIYRRDLLAAGNVIEGPALIEEATATTTVGKGETCSVDEYGNLIIALTGEGR
jgi:N-methylhydantoinase A